MVKISLLMCAFVTSSWAGAEESVKWPIADLKRAIDELSCGKTLSGRAKFTLPLNVPPRTMVSLRAHEVTERLLKGAEDQTRYQKAINAYAKKAADAGLPPPALLEWNPVSKLKPVAIRRVGMLLEWDEINSSAWSFIDGYEPYVRSALSGHMEALNQLDRKVRAMIDAITHLAQIDRDAHLIGILYAQIMDGARVVVDNLYSQTESEYRVNLESDQSPARLRDLLADFGQMYDTPLPTSVIKRLGEPEIQEYANQTIQYVRRWRDLERAAFERPNHAKTARYARDLVSTRLANDFALIATEKPRYSGSQLTALRSGLSKLRNAVKPYDVSGDLRRLDEKSRELLLGHVRNAPLLGKIIQLATFEPPVKIDEPVPPARPSPPLDQPYAVSKIPGVTAYNRWLAEKVNVEARNEHQDRLRVYQRELTEYKRLMHEHRLHEVKLLARYDLRAKARKLFLMFLAHMHPVEHFRPRPDRGFSTAVEIEGAELNAELARWYTAPAALRREADTAVTTAYDGRVPSDLASAISVNMGPHLDYLAHDYRAWATYVFVMIPPLFPNIAPPPTQLAAPRVKSEYRPTLTNVDEPATVRPRSRF